jgi:hypothetical protein
MPPQERRPFGNNTPNPETRQTQKPTKPRYPPNPGTHQTQGPTKPRNPPTPETPPTLENIKTQPTPENFSKCRIANKNFPAFFASEKTDLEFYEISKFGGSEELQGISYPKIALRGHLAALAYPFK